MKAIRLSKEDLAFISNPEFILKKNKLVKDLFEKLSVIRDDLTEDVNKNPILNIKFPPGKISKGENYRGLPYLVLDCPAQFKKDNIFAYRTIIWWGHYYSNNLILKGKYLNPFKGKLLIDLPKMKKNYFFYGRNPWQHEIDQNYIKIKELKEGILHEQILKNKFVKVTQYYDLKDLNKIGKNTNNFFKRFRDNIID